jgi:hypothetical protein
MTILGGVEILNDIRPGKEAGVVEIFEKVMRPFCFWGSSNPPFPEIPGRETIAPCTVDPNSS